MATNACLARSTVYYEEATKGCLLAGCCPTAGKKDPESKIPVKLMKRVATHAEICQVGDGDIIGKDLEAVDR